MGDYVETKTAIVTIMVNVLVLEYDTLIALNQLKLQRLQPSRLH